MKTFKHLREEIQSVAEGKRGLWDNIHAKRKRIKAGSGERMRKPGSEGAPTAAALKASQTEEVQIDESWIVHDSNGKLIKKFSTHKAAKAHAEKTGHEYASAEFYHDKIQKNVKEEAEEIFDLIEETIEQIAKENNVKFSSGRLADVVEYKFRGKILILIKPSTYMNLSGKSVNYWLQAEKIPVENLLVVTDDLALPLGALRLKGKGSDGGHNGLKNIQETLNTPNYARLRFGVGKEFSKGSQVDYVLGKWNDEEEKLIEPRIKLAVEMIQGFATIGLQRTMTAYNNK